MLQHWYLLKFIQFNCDKLAGIYRRKLNLLLAGEEMLRTTAVYTDKWANSRGTGKLCVCTEK